jgi:hypothetical protein
MRLGPLVLLALIAVVAPSRTSAQVVQAPPSDARRIISMHTGVPAFFPVADPARPSALPDDVVARLMSFDHNKDGKVQKAELAERMYTVMDRGDADGDGCLDRDELLALATAKPAAAADRGFGHGRYMIGADADVSSRLHLEGAIDDLRLEAARKDQALAIVRTFTDAREAEAKAELFATMQGILNPDQMAAFTAMFDQQGRLAERAAQLAKVDQHVRVILSSVDRRVAMLRLSPELNSRATAALKEFRSRQRPSEADRAELGRQLAPILTGEESENFLAAIARQPVVAASGFGVVRKILSPDEPQRTITFVTQ